MKKKGRASLKAASTEKKEVQPSKDEEAGNASDESQTQNNNEADGQEENGVPEKGSKKGQKRSAAKDEDDNDAEASPSKKGRKSSTKTKTEGPERTSARIRDNQKSPKKETPKETKPKSSPKKKSAAPKEYEVESIVEMKKTKKGREFLVRWKGYDDDDNSWVKEKDMICPKLIKDYLASKKKK